MKKEYWDNISFNYPKEIFNSLINDRKKIIIKEIEKNASKNIEVCDFGCGIGIYLPVLSKNFKYVHAIDFSDKLIKVAKKNNKNLKNITYYLKDLSKNNVLINKVKMGICINVLIMESLKIRYNIIKNIYKHLEKKGKLILLVPSYESAYYTNIKFIEWNVKIGVKEETAVDAINKEYKKFWRKYIKGIIPIDGVPTKHYSKEELKEFLKNIGFKKVIIKKVEYNWDTEFENPPEYLKHPYPWDWMAVVEK